MNNVGQQRLGLTDPRPWYRNPLWSESNWVSIGTKWFLTFSGKLARIVLTAATLYMSAELYPGVKFPDALNLAVFIILSFALDMGGLGLGQIAKTAREHGHREEADEGKKLSQWLIRIMIAGLVTVSLEAACAKIAFPVPVKGTMGLQDWINIIWTGVDIVLTIARLICAVNYGHVLNDLERSIAQSQVAQAQTIQSRDAQLQELNENVNQLRGAVNNQRAVAIDYDQMAKEILPYLSQMSSSILPESIVTAEKIQVVEEHILSHLNDQNGQVVLLINSLLNRGVIPSANTPEIIEEIGYQIPENIGCKLSDELQGAIQGEITPPISEEITPLNSPVIAFPISEKKAREIPQEKPLPWDDVIAKFPRVIEWQSAGLRSVTRDQIIEATNFSKNKVGRVKFSQVKGGNKRIESVLNWLTNEEPKKEDIKEESNASQLDGEIAPEITDEIADEIGVVNTDELEEVIAPLKTKNTIPLSLADLPHELRENNVVSEEEFERRKAHALKMEEEWKNGMHDDSLGDVSNEVICVSKRYFAPRPATVDTDPELTVVND